MEKEEMDPPCAASVKYRAALDTVLAWALLSSITPTPKPRMVIEPIPSLKTPEGDLIFRVVLAALTAAWAATTPDRPALIPAVRPAMAFTPMARREKEVRFAETADLAFAATAFPVPDME